MVGTTLQTLKRQKGFTIVEVVLVLAIAGLIFIIVFLAFPQLQEGRRDAQRRKDVGRVIAALETHATNNDTNYPDSQATTDAFKSTYLSNFNDPSSGNIYTLTYDVTAPAATGEMSYRNNAKCGTGGTLTAVPSGDKAVAVAIKLENGFYCEDNQ